mmetsp:Transcript_26739/g.47369  ORF Transcript_26739/g.47369 Transcript_26739/m.47369 type:complete len:85 (+) Transcript_26739:665-919(+)
MHRLQKQSLKSDRKLAAYFRAELDLYDWCLEASGQQDEREEVRDKCPVVRKNPNGSVCLCAVYVCVQSCSLDRLTEQHTGQKVG